MESQYSVRQDPRSRAIAGLSMGGRHTMFVGFLNGPGVNAKIDYLFVGQGTHESDASIGRLCGAA